MNKIDGLRVLTQTAVGLGMAYLVSNSWIIPARAQETVPVPVQVTITTVQPPIIQTSVSNGATNTASSLPLALTTLESTFLAEVCGGLGDPLQAGVDRFAELTRAREEATTDAERLRLEREIVIQGLRLPDLVREDFGNRGLVRGESPECDQLIDSVTQLMEQVADYLGALQDAKTAALW